MTDFSPREIVSELDRYIVGQADAKRAVSIALRNRWRRLQLTGSLREEVLPKNILMIGPTGVGKTEISRRLAKLAGAPFLKIDATGLPTLELSDSSDLKQGQLVLAFGSPLGLDNSVTMGVVSSVARQLDPDSPTIYVQTDIGPGATTLTIIGTISGKILSFSNIPNTPGLILTKFDTTFNKRKTGKKSYYVSARCKKGKWKTSETTTFYSGEVFTAAAPPSKCKATKSKKK